MLLVRLFRSARPVRRRREPVVGAGPGAGRAAERSPLDLRHALPRPDPAPDARLMSPRQMAEWVHELYLAGVLNWTEYGSALPPELHPDYDRTVGALTGRPAEPDRPRDMLREWEEKLAFLRRHNGWNDPQVRRAERILGLLRRSLQTGGWLGARG